MRMQNHIRMQKDVKRLLIQHRFKTHPECIENVEKLFEVLPKSEFIIIAKVNRTYFEYHACSLYLPRAQSLTNKRVRTHQRNKSC